MAAACFRARAETASGLVSSSACCPASAGILKSAGPPRETGPGTETSKKRDFSDSESELEVQSAGGTLGLAQGSPRGPLST